MIATYDPKKVTIAMDGNIITGLASKLIGIKHNENKVSTTVGVKGDTAYSINANNSGTATITLQHSSASLPYIRQKAQSGASFTFSVSDANDMDSFFVNAEDCKLLNIPELNRDKEVGETPIEVYIPDLNYR